MDAREIRREPIKRRHDHLQVVPKLGPEPSLELRTAAFEHSVNEGNDVGPAKGDVGGLLGDKRMSGEGCEYLPRLLFLLASQPSPIVRQLVRPLDGTDLSFNQNPAPFSVGSPEHADIGQPCGACALNLDWEIALYRANGVIFRFGTPGLTKDKLEQLLSEDRRLSRCKNDQSSREVLGIISFEKLEIAHVPLPCDGLQAGHTRESKLLFWILVLIRVILLVKHSPLHHILKIPAGAFFPRAL